VKSLNGYCLPELLEGDTDDNVPGPRMVELAQVMLSHHLEIRGRADGIERIALPVIMADGVYGPETVNAVKILFGSDGMKIGIAEWTTLYGLSKAATRVPV